MGWWQIDLTEKEIEDFNNSDNMLYNALPEKSNKKRLYMGDQPSDIMDEAISNINKLYKTTWHRKVTLKELLSCFEFCTSVMNNKE